MYDSSSHDATARRIARTLNAEYTEGKGADIVTEGAAIEVEPPETIGDAMRKLRGYRKGVYIAGTNREALKKALEVTAGTTVGVMNNSGDIVKGSTRKRKGK
jgi:hypothetical protein